MFTTEKDIFNFGLLYFFALFCLYLLNLSFVIYLLKGPALPVELKKNWKKIFRFLACVNHRAPLRSIIKFQPIRSNCLAGYREHIY